MSFNAIYELANVRVALHTDNETAHKWAAAFLTPFLSALTADHSIGENDEAHTSEDAHVVAIFGYSPPRPQFVNAPREVPLFLRRTGERRDEAAASFLRDVESSDWYEVHDRQVTVAYQSTEPYFIRDPARLVREYAIDLLCGIGAQRLHAAAAALDDLGILIVGPAGAGKSWTLVQLLMEGATFIANDRVLLIEGRGGWEIVGVPLAVRWSMLQIEQFASGRTYLRDYSSRSTLRMSDDTAGFAKYELTPAEIASITGRSVTPVAPLRVVVVVERDRADTVGNLTALDPTIGMLRLAACQLAVDPAFPPFFRREPQPSRTTRRQRTIEGVRWYRITARHDEAAAVARIVRELETIGPAHDNPSGASTVTDRGMQPCTSHSSPHRT